MNKRGPGQRESPKIQKLTILDFFKNSGIMPLF